MRRRAASAAVDERAKGGSGGTGGAALSPLDVGADVVVASVVLSMCWRDGGQLRWKGPTRAGTRWGRGRRTPTTTDDDDDDVDGSG